MWIINSPNSPWQYSCTEELLHQDIRPECNELRLTMDPTLDEVPVDVC
jgi:hypothetical protein